MINVAMLNTELTRGGAARMAASLNHALNEHCNGVSSVLYHSQHDKPDEQQFGMKKKGSRHINAALCRLGGSIFNYDFGFAREFAAMSVNADLLHFHNLHGYYLDWQKLLQISKAKPIVWTLHDMWIATGRCGQAVECVGWQSGCGSCPDKSKYPASLLDFTGKEYEIKTQILKSRQNIHFVSPSQWLADIMIQRGAEPSRVHVIQNPVDVKKFKPINSKIARAKLGLSQKKSIVLFVASDCNDQIKGYQDLARLVGQGSDFQLLVVGKPPAERLDHAIYIGSVTDQSLLNQYYSAADVMVVPSYADNYPNTVIESLASGTPVIGYDEGGIPSQLKGMPACKIVQKGNLDALSNALSTYLAAPLTKDDRYNLAQEASKRWAAGHVARLYAELYERIRSQSSFIARHAG